MLHGDLFSQLERAQALNNEDDLLLVSRKTGDSYESMAICLSDLIAQLNSELEESCDIGSIAYEDADEYASKDHDHDIYTSAWYKQTMHDPSNMTVLCVDDMTHSQHYELAISASGSSSQESYDEWRNTISGAQPSIGTLKIAGISQLSGYDIQTDITLSTFIGWVPADGSLYSLSDFVQADILNAMYGNEDGLTFTVPRLTSFCKLNAGSLQANEHHMGAANIAKHTHAVEKTGESKLNINANANSVWPKTFQISSYKDPKQNGTGLHNGVGSATGIGIFAASAKIDENSFDSLNISIQPEGEPADGRGAYPSHTTVPAFVYIGRSLSSAALTADAQS